MKNLLVLALVAFALALPSTGCSIFESGCTKALPALASLNVYFDNMQTAITRAQLAVNTIANPDVRKKAQDALDAVMASLQLAQTLQQQAVSACTTPDVATIFAGVIKTWKALEPFIALLAGPGGSGGSRVPTPLVVAQYGG